MIDLRGRWYYDAAMRLLPSIALCLAILPACKTEPTDPGHHDDPPEPVAEDEFAARAAATLCAQVFACECGDNPSTPETEQFLAWADEATCVAEKQPYYEEFLAAQLEGGGTYSDECGGRFIADFERTDCLSLWAYLAEGGHHSDFYEPQACPLVNRERAVGDPCDPYGSYYNDCGEGKVCGYDDFTCVEIGELPVPEGESCEVASVDLPCAPGLYCTYNQADNTQTCQRAPELGDPCPNYSCFSQDLSCDYETLTCVAAAGEGESCEAQGSCMSGFYCDGGQEFTCVAQYEYGHGCSADAVCADGGRCINNICTPPSPWVCGEV